MSKRLAQTSRRMKLPAPVALALGLAPAVVLWLLIHVPDEPSERISSGKEPGLVAGCIAEAYGGTAKPLAEGVFEFSVRSGKNALQMQFVIAHTVDGSLVQVRRGALYALSNRWRSCL